MDHSQSRELTKLDFARAKSPVTVGSFFKIICSTVSILPKTKTLETLEKIRWSRTQP